MKPTTRIWFSAVRRSVIGILALSSALVATAARADEKIPTEQEIIRPFLMDGWGIISPTPLDAYLQSVMAKLAANAGTSIAAPHVYVVPMDQFQAECGADGGIMVTTGLLSYLRSEPALANEDALAFILAHELSHMTLGHTAERERTRHLMKTVSMLTMLSGAGAAGYGALTHLGQGLIMGGFGSQVAMDEALFPGWSNSQETEADENAVNIMVKAGYSTNVIPAIMEAIKKAEPAPSDSKLVTADRTQQGGVKFGFNFGQLIKDVLPNDHPTATARDADVRNYILKNYPAVFAPLHTTGYSAAMSRADVSIFLANMQALLRALASGDPVQAETAVVSLRSADAKRSQLAQFLTALVVGIHGGDAAALPYYLEATHDPYAMERTFWNAARLEHNRGNNPESLVLLREAYDRIGDDRILPYVIWLAKVTNNSTVSTEFDLKCTLVSGDLDLAKGCADAGVGKSPPWQ